MWEKALTLTLTVLGFYRHNIIVLGQSMKVHGVTTGNRNISSFWAIPFAAPPVGDLRFAVSVVTN